MPVMKNRLLGRSLPFPPNTNAYFKRLSLPVTLLLSFFLHSSVYGQPVLLYQKDGIEPDGSFGLGVALTDDMDGDEKSEFIIGNPRAFYGGNGVVWVYSGATGNLLYQKNDIGGWLGFSVAGIGDIDGDSRAEFILGAPFANPGQPTGTGSAYVYSGATGALIYQKDGVDPIDDVGSSVGGTGDVDGDGWPDFIVGSPTSISLEGDTAAGSIFVYSGVAGNLIYRKDGAAFNDRFGTSVAGGGDVDGDGRADFIVGAEATDTGGVGNVGSIYVYSGATGVLLYQKDGPSFNARLGTSVEIIGDVNGDGRAEFAAGASVIDKTFIYSGADGQLLYEKYGWVVGKVGDVNRDGRADFIVGDPAFNEIVVYSGIDSDTLARIFNAVVGEFGRAVDGGEDVNGDGPPDIIVSAPRTDPNGISDAGSVYVYDLNLPCPFSKGDLNNSGNLSPADVVLMLNCVFTASGICDICFTDVNCSGNLSPADVVIELNMVFSGELPPC